VGDHHDSHGLVVEGWDRNEIQITGEYDPSEEEMTIREDGETLVFELEPEGRRGRGFNFGRGQGTDGPLQLRVPRGAHVELETISGDVTVTGLRGTLDASAVSGRVEATGNMQTVELTTISGRVRYTGNAEVVQLESVSGSVGYNGTATTVSLEGVSGGIVMDGGAQNIDVETVSGSVRVASSTPIRVLDASSVSGSVEVRGGIAPGARVDVESHSGTVELEIVGPTDAEFELESFSGSVDARLAGMRDVLTDRSRTTSSESMSFRTGRGTGRVSVSSFSGSARITAAP
jgi:DUF4097 and DUF4098 domain-containing protein YvlB